MDALEPSLLREVAEAQRQAAESPRFGRIGDEVAAVLAGTALGLLNGVIITRLGILPFITTLAMLRLVEAGKMQLDAGVDAIQIFDSWGGVLGPNDFVEASTKWIAKIIERLPGVPFIVFCKGAMLQAEAVAATGARVVGVDWTADIADIRRRLPEHAVQGNLDPIVLETTPTITRRETRRILDSMAGLGGHIFNLGHGISPEGRIDCMEAMVDEIRLAGAQQIQVGRRLRHLPLTCGGLS